MPNASNHAREYYEMINETPFLDLMLLGIAFLAIPNIKEAMVPHTRDHKLNACECSHPLTSQRSPVQIADPLHEHAGVLTCTSSTTSCSVLKTDERAL